MQPAYVIAQQLVDPSTIADPYPVYHSLRSESPVRYSFTPDGALSGARSPVWTWAFLKYQDVVTALRNHETFSSDDPLRVFRPKIMLVQHDRPRHTELRRLLNRALTAERIAALQTLIIKIANDLLDKIGEKETDIIESYAVPLPAKVIAGVLGIPPENYATVRRWSLAFFSTGTDQDNKRSKNMEELVRYFQQLVNKANDECAKDFIHNLMDARIKGDPLQDWELLASCVTFLMAATLTITNMIGNMLGILADRPELWEQLRKDRSLINSVIEETLRYESPVQRLARIATRDVEISGAKISRGERVTIFFGAANRDPAAFEEADTFRLNRDLRNHLGFGMGIHYCLGAPLARAEAEITVNAFLDRFSIIKRGTTPSVRQRASAIAFGFERLPLLLVK